MRFLPKEVNAFLLTWASYLLMKVQTTAKKLELWKSKMEKFSHLSVMMAELKVISASQTLMCIQIT